MFCQLRALISGTALWKSHWKQLVLAAFAVLVALIGMVAKSDHDVLTKSPDEPHNSTTNHTATRLEVALVIPEIADSSPPATERPRSTTSEAPGIWHEIVIRRGDTLSSIFGRLKIHRDLAPLMTSAKEFKALRLIRPGQRIRLRINAASLEELIYESSTLEQLHALRTPHGFDSTVTVQPLETRQVLASGTIDQSLFLAGRRAGLSDKLIMQLAGIFAWDIDFALDIRHGDGFTVIYEQHYVNGEKLQDGEIVAAEFINQDKIFRAIQHETESGEVAFYTPEGRSVRGQFLRTPVDIARITSQFNLKRKHPILNRIRKHKGVDYAAPTGTPIRATGNGKVVFRGRKGGYGRTVILKHGSAHTTLYAHMSRFARKLRTGQRVKQGQVIGYIGRSGRATGPHLHYEFRVNGVHRDPLRVKLPKAKSLPKSEIANFEVVATQAQAQMVLYRRTLTAMERSETTL